MVPPFCTSIHTAVALSSLHQTILLCGSYKKKFFIQPYFTKIVSVWLRYLVEVLITRAPVMSLSCLLARQSLKFYSYDIVYVTN